MTLKMYSIYDSKGEVFNNPFYCHTHGEAERNFTQLIRDPKSLPNQHPLDFDLFYVGNYDNLTGKIDPLPSPTHIIKGLQCVDRNSTQAVQ